MSCTEVMYQAYYPYLYQRSSSTAAPPTRAPHHHFAPFTHQYDRLRAFETHQQHQASTSSPIGGGSDSPANRWTTIADHADSHHSSVGSGASSVGPVGITSPASSPATANSASVVHKEEDTSRDDTRTEMDEDEDNVQDDSRARDRRTAAHAQYVSVNCVVFTHYTGDAAAVVDEHFSRALNNDQKLNNGGHQSQSTKDTSSMSSRNFPASFWNSNYHSHHSTSQVYHPDTVYHHHSAAGNPTDPWQTHYQQYTAAAAHHHHRAVHEYHHHHNMAAQYGSLLLPPPTSRLAPPPPPPPPPSSHPHPHQYHSKTGMEPWPNSAHHPALDTGASYSSYPTVPGLDAQVQETSKDLYWF